MCPLNVLILSSVCVQMVPRDWFRGGLLKDLAYYKPFST